MQPKILMSKQSHTARADACIPPYLPTCRPHPRTQADAPTIFSMASCNGLHRVHNAKSSTEHSRHTLKRARATRNRILGPSRNRTSQTRTVVSAGSAVQNRLLNQLRVTSYSQDITLLATDNAKKSHHRTQRPTMLSMLSCAAVVQRQPWIIYAVRSIDNLHINAITLIPS